MRVLLFLFLFSARAFAGANVALTWSATPGAASYNVYFGMPAVLITNVTVTNVTLPDAIAGRTNCWVTALDAAGNESDPSNLLTLANLQTCASTNLSATNWTLIAETMVDETTNDIQFFRQVLK